jgi:hypothetical protein
LGRHIFPWEECLSSRRRPFPSGTRTFPWGGTPSLSGDGHPPSGGRAQGVSGRVRWRRGGRGSWCWSCGLWAFCRRLCASWCAWLAPSSRAGLRLGLALTIAGSDATSVLTCGGLPRCGARCACAQLCRARASRRARARRHRRRSWRQRQTRFSRRCGLTNEPPDCALRGVRPDASLSVPTWYWPRTRSIAFRLW